MNTITNIIDNNATKAKFIDIEKVIASKNPRLLKHMPKFVINFFKRILHEEKLNTHIQSQSGKYGLDFVKSTLAHFKVHIQIHGIYNIPQEERLLIASNHPLGGLDGLTLMLAAGHARSDIIFPVNDLLMNLDSLKDFFIPINKHGGNPKEAVKMLDDFFSSDKTILFFPAGLVSRKIKGKISDLEWKKTFVSKARKHHRKIIPTFIDGKNSNFFYNLANLRKWLGIKANIEMFFLVDEMYKQKNKRINIYFGEPISVDALSKEMSDEEIAIYVKKCVYELQNKKYKDEKKVIYDLTQTMEEHATIN